MAIDPRVEIGHVHLKVADIERSLDFWCGVLGFDRRPPDGRLGTFVSAGARGSLGSAIYLRDPDGWVKPLM